MAIAMKYPRIVARIGFTAIACWMFLIALNGRSYVRHRTNAHGIYQDVTQKWLFSRSNFHLNANGSAIHLKGVAPVVIDVDVWMHVVSAEPSNVTDHTLRKQLSVLNDDYAPSGIHFRLQGITRTKHLSWSLNSNRLARSRALRMGNYSTLNLYYIDHFHNLPKKLAFTTYPATLTPHSDDYYLDGCTINKGTLPGGDFTPYNLGRTTTHEVGHWFGLMHTFERNSCYSRGDRVDDTPTQAVAATKGCAARQDSCPDQPGFDDTSNFMDYGNDACMNGITAGQARRMHDQWRQYRAGVP